MKRILFVIMIMCSISMQARIFSKDAFQEANSGGSIGIVGGVLGIYDDLSSAGIGLNGMYKGIYLDFLFWPRAHSSSTDVNYHKDEKQSVSVHAGYQFPITSNIRIIPVVGYTSVRNGDTDGSRYSISSGHINNSYIVKDKNEGFDYGAVISIGIKKVNIYAAGTRYGVYGGVGIRF